MREVMYLVVGDLERDVTAMQLPARLEPIDVAAGTQAHGVRQHKRRPRQRRARRLVLINFN